jgi:hypothetical protein
MRCRPGAMTTQSLPTHTQPIAVIAGGYEAVPLRLSGQSAPYPVRGGVEALLFSRIDGATTIAELATACGLTAREVLHLVTGMVLEGRVEIANASSIRGTSVVVRAESLEPQANDYVDFSDVMEELEASGTDD